MVEAPLPLNGEVLDLRAAGGIVGVLEDWHDAVRTSRDLDDQPRTGSLGFRVNTAAWGLIHHIHFIALWDQAPVLGREIRDLVDRVLRIVDPEDDTPPAHVPRPLHRRRLGRHGLRIHAVRGHE
jgi:hypothetical protein